MSDLEPDGYLDIFQRNGSSAPVRYPFKEIRAWTVRWNGLHVFKPDKTISYPLHNVLRYEIVKNSDAYVESRAQEPPQDTLACVFCNGEHYG